MPCVPRLKPFAAAALFAGLKPGASTRNRRLEPAILEQLLSCHIPVEQRFSGAFGIALRARL